MSRNRKFINQIEPFIDHTEMEYLAKVVESTFVTEHTLTKEFEELFKNYTGAKHVISYTNGTVALYAILQSLGIGPGDEVIVPDLTFIATANSVILAGATPIFCDIETKNFGLDLSHAKKLITKKTKAIVPVHLYGLSARMDELKVFCEENNLFLIVFDLKNFDRVEQLVHKKFYRHMWNKLLFYRNMGHQFLDLLQHLKCIHHLVPLLLNFDQHLHF